MIRWLFKWLLRLLALAVVLGVAALLLLNPILRVVIENRIRAQTGLDAEIGRFHLGLLQPTLEIQDLKIYNPPSFGGAPLLDIPEIHVEYDRAALARHRIHLTLLRLNLAELDIVRNEAGQTNLFSLGLPPPGRALGGANAGAQFRKQTGFDFEAIDVLNVSVGRVRFLDLKNPRDDREQNIGLDNCVVKNVKSPADLTGLALLVALRGGSFFGALLNTNR
ncbi:MAG: hypothetical protein KGJ60_15730 [Verrucomicrobiota bacterium]|nr:hypothetical protein [Verrucomicrobiota bacterium]